MFLAMPTPVISLFSLYSRSSFEILILDLAFAPKFAPVVGLFGIALVTKLISAAASSFLIFSSICSENYYATAFVSCSFLGIATKLKESSTGDSFRFMPSKWCYMANYYFVLLSSRSATLVLFMSEIKMDLNRII